MASSDSGNLATEFEKSFKNCLLALTNPDQLNIVDPEETKTYTDQSIVQFLDLAKQMECFFLKKRLLFSVQKPELIVREDTSELKKEIVRKDDLLKKHYEKLSYWQNLLAEVQGAPRPTNLHPQNLVQSSIPTPNQSNITQNQQTVPSHPPNLPQHVSHQVQYPTSLSVQSSIGAQGGSGLQGPLAYLEQTTSNIGMGDHSQR